MSCNELWHTNHLINLSRHWSDQYTVSSFFDHTHFTNLGSIWVVGPNIVGSVRQLWLKARSMRLPLVTQKCLLKTCMSVQLWPFFIEVACGYSRYVDIHSCVARELGSMMSWMHELKLLITSFAERVSTKELEWTTCTTLTMGFGRYNSAHMPCTFLYATISLASPVRGGQTYNL